MGSTSVASLAASSVLVAASGVVCDSSQFSLEVAVSKKKLLTSDGARTKSSVSLIKQVALVGQQHEAFGLQGRVVDVAHVGQAHPCYTSRTTEYPLTVYIVLLTPVQFHMVMKRLATSNQCITNHTCILYDNVYINGLYLNKHTFAQTNTFHLYR